MDADAIVVGAGPGGSSAAYYLATLGRRVLLLDRARFPRDKSCGDGLTRSATRLLFDMGVLGELENAQKAAGVRVFMRGKGARDFLYPRGKFTPDHGLVVPRYMLDHVLCRRAVLVGAELQEGVIAVRLRRGSTSMELDVLQNGSQNTLQAAVIVAADGAASRLAAQAGLAPRAAQTTGFAIRGYYTAIDGLNDLLEIYLPLMDSTDRYILPSYGWVFPTSAGTANVGVGIFERNENLSLRDLMDRFVDDLRQRDGRFARMQLIGRLRGAPLNFGFHPDRCMAPGLLLVGDAAGLVSPFTGEGISYAIESGKIAAETIHRNLRADAASLDLSDYPLMLEKKYLGYFESGREGARRYLLLWHLIESTFHNEAPFFALCRKAALFPEGIGDTHPSEVLEDVSPLIVPGPLHVREDLLAVGEILLHALRKDWPFLARTTVSGHGDPGIPFRPALLLMLCASAVDPLVRDAQRHRLLNAAAAVELGYLAALAHLSVEEDAPLAEETRLRGDHPANWGNMLALICGDFLLAKAYELSAVSSADTTRMISEALASVCRGRIREHRQAFRLDLPEDEVLLTTTLKMATLFELPCHLGAILAGAASAEADALADYGRKVGLAFTFADQVLAYTGRASELGRLMTSNPREGYFSRPLLKAARHRNWHDIAEIVNRPPSVLSEALDASNALASTLDEAREFSANAKTALLSVLPDGPARVSLCRLADYAADRELPAKRDLHALLL